MSERDRMNEEIFHKEARQGHQSEGDYLFAKQPKVCKCGGLMELIITESAYYKCPDCPRVEVG